VIDTIEIRFRRRQLDLQQKPADTRCYTCLECLNGCLGQARRASGMRVLRES
jgi:hypothetical protein